MQRNATKPYQTGRSSLAFRVIHQRCRRKTETEKHFDVCQVLARPLVRSKSFPSLQPHLGTLDPAALGRLAEHLAAVAGAELAAGAVPQVAVVTHGALKQAAPFGGGTLVAALPGTLHFGVTLRGSSTLSQALISETKIQENTGRACDCLTVCFRSYIKELAL